MSGERGYSQSDEYVSIASRIVGDFLSNTDLPVGDQTECPYLPGRETRSEAFFADEKMNGGIHRAFMDRGFRRCGRVFYRPTCPDCTACVPIRIPVETFHASKSMRRVWQKNSDVRSEIGQPIFTDVKCELFNAYLDSQHDGTMSGNRDEMWMFLYNSPVPTIEVCYYIGNRLIGVSLIDVCPDAFSSVYMFFDPTEAWRSLGTYSILWEIDHCRSESIAYYYLGFWVPGSKTMEYKARFQPAEILDSNGYWVPWTDSASEETRSDS